MNVREAMRSVDPAHRLPPQTFSESDEQVLRAIIAAPQEADPVPARPAPRRTARKPLITTGLVAIAVITGTVLAIRAVPTTTPVPATTPTPTLSADRALQAAVDVKLAAATKQQRLDPNLPAQTWADDRQGSQGGMIDLTGRTLYLAAACTGGGTVTIQIAGQLDTTIDCTTTAAIGPINLSAIAAHAEKGIGYDIAASSGQPEYYAKAVAVASSDVTTTSSVDIDGRTLLIYPASGAGGDRALLHGVLGQNRAGCITVGEDVLLAPSNTQLHPDGSISFGSVTLEPGRQVDLGGATAASIPVGSPCQAAAGDYFTVGDYPQPQPN